MKGIAAWLRRTLRAKWRATVVLTLLVGLAGAAALGAADGARRTQTAYPRMRAATKAADMLLSVAGTGLTGYYDAVARLPQVAAFGPLVGVPVTVVRPDGTPDPDGFPSANAGIDARAFFDVERPKIVSGRMIDPSVPGEAFADLVTARQYHVHTGSTLRMWMATDPSYTHGTFVSFTIVGVGVVPQGVVPTTPLDAQPHLILTPAFYRSQPSLTSRQNLNYDGAYLRFKPGADTAAFEASARALAKKYPDTFGQTFIQRSAQAAARAQHSIVPLAIALYVFAALCALAALFVLGQAISRQQFLESGEFPALRAIGFTPSQLVVAGLARVSVIAIGGAALAAAGATAISPFMPIGPARLAEPRPGFEANIALLAIGAVAIIAAVLARAAVPAVRAVVVARARDGVSGVARASSVGEAAARAGLGAPLVSGIRMAYERPSGSRSVPLRAAMAGVVLGITALIAVLAFGSSLNRLITVPSQYGWDWDVVADAAFGVVPMRTLQPALARDPDVAGYAAGTYGDMIIAGRDVPAVGLDTLQGDVYLRVLQGRAARADDEIVLGSGVMRAAHTAVGKTVNVTIDGRVHAMRVVGRAVFPSLGRGSFAPTSLGDGAAVVGRWFADDARHLSPTPTDDHYNFMLVGYRAGANVARAEQRLRSTFLVGDCAQVNDCTVVTSARPIELNVLSHVESGPFVLAALVALLAAATLAHALLASVRTRKRDLAVLKTLGFVKRQVRAVVAWQSSALTIAALVVGIPLGIVVARAGWAVFANAVGVSSSSAIPLVAVLVMIPATLVLANVIASVPARAAARTRPAEVLHAE